MAKTCPTCSNTYPDNVVFCSRDGSGLISTSSRDDLIGEVIADMYLVTDLLGEGGMGTVYHARHVRLPQQVAIKILHANRSSDPAHALRFRQEAESASRIDHDRVARVYDFGTTASGEAYIAMEYVPGRTLAAVLEERGTFEPVEAAQIVFMVAEGLDAAHRIGIIHRDLKPENIMIVDDEEGSIRVKVLDFGIAKMVGGLKNATLTQHGFIIGSPSYMSPEQVMGETLDARSDVYSLGLLAFVMLTGVRPFSGATPEAEMLARLTGAPNKLSDSAPTVSWPPELQDIFDRTFARDVTTRPPRAKTFADEFFNAVNAWKGARRPPGMTPSGPISRPPFTAPTLSAVTVPSGETPQPVVASGGSRRWAIAGASVAFALVASAAAYKFAGGEKGTTTALPGVGTASLASAPPNAGTPANSNPSPGAPTTKILASSAAEKAQPVTVDVTKPEGKKPATTALKPAPELPRGASVAPAPTVPVVDSAAIIAAAMAAAAEKTAKAPVVVPEAKAAAPEAPAKSAAELNNELKATIRAYADAIESHETSRLRAAFPLISPALLDQYGMFFQFARNIKVNVNGIELSDPLLVTPGTRVHAHVKVTINYRNDSKRKDEHDSSVWQAVLSRTVNGWQLVELQ